MIEVRKIGYAYRIKVDMEYIIISISDWQKIKHEMAIFLKE